MFWLNNSGKEEQACCDHIVSNVDLKWELPDCSGKATLQGIQLTPSMVQLVTVSPIHWGVSFYYIIQQHDQFLKNMQLRPEVRYYFFDSV